MDDVTLLPASVDPLLSCCMCKRLPCETVLLKCLHNCCRQCFITARLTADSEGVSCAACGVVTHDGSEQPNGFIDDQVLRYRLMAELTVCSVCKGNGEHDKPALMWCAACLHSLCGDCIPAHRQYNRQHVTQSLEELTCLDEVCMQPSASACAIHKKPLDIACRNCEKVKCICCWEECHENKHEMHVVGKESFDIYVGKFISSVASTESELLRKSEVLQRPKSVLLETKAARDRHLKEIHARKRRVVEAVEMVYQEIEFYTKNAYDELEAECHNAAAVADRIDADLSDARLYVRRLVECSKKCDIVNQQKIVRERLNFLSAELDNLRERLSMKMRELKIEASLPEDVEDIVRAWIGSPRLHAGSSPAASSPSPSPSLVRQAHENQASSSPPASQPQQQQSVSFGSASAIFQMPVRCEDLALMPDGRSLLLAALEHGLIELSSASGRELSRWLPPKKRSNLVVPVDQVQAVTALSDGRAAVSLEMARLVVLLRRNEKSGSSRSTGAALAAAALAAAADDDAWTEDRRLVGIQPPWWLSAHGDILAASSGVRLRLFSLSGEQRLSDTAMQRDYIIGSLAVTSRLVVTGSYDEVFFRGSGRRAGHVLEAHSLDAGGCSEKRLWRNVMCRESKKEDERLWGVCADASSGCLYAAVCRSDQSSGRVSVLNLADGSELRSFALAAAASKLLLLPRRLSLCDNGATAADEQPSSRTEGRVLLMAALCLNQRTMTLHRSTIDMLE